MKTYLGRDSRAVSEVLELLDNIVLGYYPGSKALLDKVLLLGGGRTRGVCFGLGEDGVPKLNEGVGFRGALEAVVSSESVDERLLQRFRTRVERREPGSFPDRCLRVDDLAQFLAGEFGTLKRRQRGSRGRSSTYSSAASKPLSFPFLGSGAEGTLQGTLMSTLAVLALAPERVATIVKRCGEATK